VGYVARVYCGGFMFEKDVPIPALVRYPFADLLPGESVLYVCAPDQKIKARKAAYRVAEYHQWKIVVRSLKDGVRCWRIS
jgi:hypothetical protein